MTIKYLTGAYPDGYQVENAFDAVVVERTADVAGLRDNFPGTVENFGLIEAASTFSEGADGVVLSAGVLTNGSARHTAALISGEGGVLINGQAGFITNFGTITASYDSGVEFVGGGSLTNHGVIDGAVVSLGYASVVVFNGSNADQDALIGPNQHRYGGGVAIGSGAVANYGTIDGPYYGVDIALSGTIRNGSADDRTALIEGGGVGVTFGRQATVQNYGTIQAGVSGVEFTAIFGRVANLGEILADGTGVLVSEPGHGSRGAFVINGSDTETTAVIEGATGVATTGANLRHGTLTLVNYGTIVGTGGTAVSFGNAGDVLRLETGATFAGEVLGAGGTLELAGADEAIASIAQGNVTLERGGVAAAFTDFGAVLIDRHAPVTITGQATIAAGETAALDVKGKLWVAGSLLDSADLTGSGSLSIGADAFAEIAAAPASLDVRLAGAGANLTLSTPSTFAATVRGFAPGDVIDLVATLATSATLETDDRLVIADGSATVATLQLAGPYGHARFSVTADGDGGAEITVDLARKARAFAAAMANTVPDATAAPGLGGGSAGWRAPDSTIAAPARTWMR